MSSLHISQNVKLGQTISQKMIQSVKILQMNAQELSDFISELSLENPMVELSPESSDDADEMRLQLLSGHYSPREMEVFDSKPLSDQKICDLLQEQGIAVSRRTVAKYREEMGIGSTRERKSWK